MAKILGEETLSSFPLTFLEGSDNYAGHCGPSLYESSSLCSYSEIVFTWGLVLLGQNMLM